MLLVSIVFAPLLMGPIFKYLSHIHRILGSNCRWILEFFFSLENFALNNVMKVTASYIPNKESSARLQLSKHKEDTEMYILVWSSFYLAAFTLAIEDEMCMDAFTYNSFFICINNP